jgi:thiol-disulfide isomerase/thioredoxin
MQAPNVVFKSVDGQQVQLGSLRGRPVLIDIWATWSAPCIWGFRDLARLYEETRKTGLAILSTDVSDDPKTAQDYLLKMGYK